MRSIDEIFSIFKSHPRASYILHGGNTAHGVYRQEPVDIYIDLNDVPELHRVQKTESSLTLGGNVSMTLAMESFEERSKDPGFEYMRRLAKHIDLIASVPVRNIGTIAGNLMIKHRHREFPSDLFLIFETVGAEVHVLEAPGKKSSVSLLEFLDVNMRNKIIYSLVFPRLSKEYEFRSYKIMPRAQNAHAFVNAGFLFKLDGGGRVLEKPNIIFGGINEHFLHASNTENFLMGKSIVDKDTWRAAVDTLQKELKPDYVLPDYTPKFRRKLALGLFYKFALGIKPENLEPKLRSGASLLERPLSSAKQDFETNKSLWPLSQPLPKLESIYQTSGEARYVNDLPPFPHQVFCAFVLSELANATIEAVDAREALSTKGVVAFFKASDVPGKNLFIAGSEQMLFVSYDEPLFAENRTLFAGQPIGVIAAESQALANEAAAKVKVKYAEAARTKPVVSIDDALEANDRSRFVQVVDNPAQQVGNDTKHVIKGTFRCGPQYHYTMEPQSCVCVPVEDGMDVYPAAQWMDLVQVSIAQCLAVKNNSINIQVRRIGGGYGAKISRGVQVACACALVCHKLARPARFVLTIEDNMRSVGKRNATRQDYEIGVNADGRIQYLNSQHWSNSGSSFNEGSSPYIAHHLPSCYDASTWSITGFETKTDQPSCTYCRAPASTEAIAATEHMMEHIARVVGKDPLEVRLLNMNEKDKEQVGPMIENLSSSADFEMRKRAVETFNKENRWKKRGISLVPQKYPILFFGHFHAMVSIYAHDGTVSISHGGIECGQGIHTKIAQTAAHTLGIDLDMVSVKPSNNFTAPNNMVTGGSITSESCAYATVKACEQILEKLKPIREELGNPTWQELIMAAHTKDVPLCAHYMASTARELPVYVVYGVVIAEVELDLLTGQHVIDRVDLMEDAGQSMNPDVDLGQVEGAFVMGIGYWTSEDLIYDPNTGQLTNYRTWNYKPPGAKDIPVDFRVSFRKNARNEKNIFGAKATGEPPLCMSCVIPLAIRQALNSARADVGNADPWYQLDGPVTTEKILLTSLTNKNNMLL